MEIFVILILILTLLILAIGLNIKIGEIKKIKTIAYDSDLTEITNKLPENKEVCKEILNMLDNKNVLIEDSKDETNKTSLYLVMKNKIIIANIKDTFTRIQTIAHECVHSTQNKVMLKFNYIFSNIYMLYFFIICLLKVFKVIKFSNINILLLITLIMMGVIYFIVRSFLEIDAMTRAEYITKQYIKSKDLITKEETNKLMQNYGKINDIGIKLYIFILASKCIIKTIIFCIISLIFTV